MYLIQHIKGPFKLLGEARYLVKKEININIIQNK